jgi:5'-3' exonuclease
MKQFNTFTETEASTLMIVDALNLAFRYKHSGAKDFVEDYCRTVDSLKRSYKASKVIIVCDQGSSSYRKAIYPEYKQNRKDKYDEQTEVEALAFELFFKEFNKTMDNIEYPLLRFDKCEADDIAAYIVSKRKKFNNIWLVSSDRDWDLLIDENVSRFSYVTRKEVTLNNWGTHYDCTPEEYISIKCLTGDSGDNITGVDKVGPVKAKELVSKYGTAYDVAACLPITSKYKYIANLNEFGEDNIIRNYRLMDLVTHCEEALGPENVLAIDNVLKDYLDE